MYPRNYAELDGGKTWEYFWYFLDQCFADKKTFKVIESIEVDNKLRKCLRMRDFGLNVV